LLPGSRRGQLAGLGLPVRFPTGTQESTITVVSYDVLMITCLLPADSISAQLAVWQYDNTVLLTQLAVWVYSRPEHVRPLCNSHMHRASFEYTHACGPCCSCPACVPNTNKCHARNSTLWGLGPAIVKAAACCALLVSHTRLPVLLLLLLPACVCVCVLGVHQVGVCCGCVCSPG
jgi:hypothetical protein